jgi:hypothetical protein
MSDQVFEVYLRDSDGDTCHKPLREGLKQFLSNDGYRLTLNVEGVAITMRRNTEKDQQTMWLDEQLNQLSEDVMVTIRGL